MQEKLPPFVEEVRTDLHAGSIDIQHAVDAFGCHALPGENTAVSPRGDNRWSEKPSGPMASYLQNGDLP